MSKAGIPARQHQICHIPAVQAAERDIINSCYGDKFRGRTRVIDTKRSMYIHGPASHTDRIVKIPLFFDIVFRQNIVPHKSSGLPCSGTGINPFQYIVCCLRIFSAVFNIIPDSKHQPPQFQIDILTVKDHVPLSPILKGPVSPLYSERSKILRSVYIFQEIRIRYSPGKGRGRILHLMSAVHGLKIKGIPHCHGIRRLRCFSFPKFTAFLPAHAV